MSTVCTHALYTKGTTGVAAVIQISSVDPTRRCSFSYVCCPIRILHSSEVSLAFCNQIAQSILVWRLSRTLTKWMFILILLIDRPYPASALRVYQEAADVPRTYIMVRKEMPFPSS